MKTVISIFLFAGIIFAAGEFFRSWLFFQKSRELVKKSVSFERIDPSAELKILILGDSTAVGTGAMSPSDSVAGRFGRDFPDAHIVNLGKNGNRVKNLVEEFNPEDYQNFKLVLIQVGGNDILRFTLFSQLEKDLDILLKKSKHASNNVVVLHSGNIGLAPFFPRFLGWIWSYRTRQVRDLYVRLAKENNSVYVDLYTEKKDDPFLRDVKRFYAQDFLHASGDGYQIWYNKIRESLVMNNINF